MFQELWKWKIGLKMVQKQRLEFFCRKRVLRNFAKFTGKHLCLFNKVAGLSPVDVTRMTAQQDLLLANQDFMKK